MKFSRSWVGRSGAGNLLGVLLLMIAFSSVVAGLVQTFPGLDAHHLAITALSAVLLGWLLAKSPLPGTMAGMVALSLGLESVLVRVGQLQPWLAAVARTAAQAGTQALQWPLADWSPSAQPDLSLLGNAALGLGTTTGSLLAQLGGWLQAFARGQPTFDPLTAALVWNLTLWATAGWAAWSLRRRRQPLAGLLPAGAVLASILSYSGDSPAPLLGLLGAAIPLLGLEHFQCQMARWQSRHIDYPEDTSLDMGLATAGLTIGLMAAAVLAPTITIWPVTRWARQLLHAPAAQSDRIAESLGLGRAGTGTYALDLLRTAGLPRGHLIGAGPELSEQVALTVRTLSPAGGLPTQPYMRSHTYQTYTGRGWLAGASETETYKAGQASTVPPPFPHQHLEQEIRTTIDTEGLLYVAGTLLSADRGYQVDWREPPTDTFGATINWRSYRAESWLSAPGPAALRATGEDYPLGVQERYLQLPGIISTRTITLAHQLTAAAPTPYDKAVAIEHYLRTYTYTLDLPAPPAGREVVDYFLFDLRRGYCDYYATAMVVLARAAGLPARMVVGYAGGSFDAEQDQAIITEANAHSWVEVFFPGFGWIEFEPTAGLPALARAAGPDEPVIARHPPTIDVEFVARWWWLSVSLPLLAAAAWLLTDWWRLRQLSPAAINTELYRRLWWHGRRLGATGRGDTPFEFRQRMVRRLSAVAPETRLGKLMRPAGNDVIWLVSQYVSWRYGRYRPDRDSCTRAIRTWQRLRWRLLLAQLLSRSASVPPVPTGHTSPP